MPMNGDLLSLPSPECEISLYLHLPFCKHRCPYCHFYVTLNDPTLHGRFVDDLLLELDLRLDAFKGRHLRSVYLGGGTPSLVHVDQLYRLFEGMKKRLIFHPELEISMEANPEGLSKQLIEKWQSLGINRLSVGIQSLVDEELLALGRGHRSNVALQAMQCLANSSLRSYSLDLMIETPRQNNLSWKKTLSILAQNIPHHLSLYNLVIEPGTAFAGRQKKIESMIVGPEQGRIMLDDACMALEEMGLHRYEISAFARHGHESIHNTGYWRGRSFIGLGPSAFSFFATKRFQNIANLESWSQQLHQNQDPTNLIDELSPHARQAELLSVQLRLCEGVNLREFIKRWQPLSCEILSSIKNLKNEGYLEQQGHILQLTKQGQLFYDRVASELIILD